MARGSQNRSKRAKVKPLEPGDHFSMRIPIDTDRRVCDVLNELRDKRSLNKVGSHILLTAIAHAIGLEGYREGGVEDFMTKITSNVGSLIDTSGARTSDEIAAGDAKTLDTVARQAQGIEVGITNQPASIENRSNQEKSRDSEMVSNETSSLQKDVSEERRRRILASQSLRKSLSGSTDE